LKARGKAVVVITHDDRYFSIADRVIKLDYGNWSRTGGRPSGRLNRLGKRTQRGVFDRITDA